MADQNSRPANGAMADLPEIMTTVPAGQTTTAAEPGDAMVTDSPVDESGSGSDAAPAVIRAATVEEGGLDISCLEQDVMNLRSKIHVLPGAEDSATSYQIDFEDHTLGNALRWIITKNPKVELCGYTIPHPSEEKMNLRIQTWEGTAREALEKGLDDLMDLCDMVADKFVTAKRQHDAANPVSA